MVHGPRPTVNRSVHEPSNPRTSILDPRSSILDPRTGGGSAAAAAAVLEARTSKLEPSAVRYVSREEGEGGWAMIHCLLRKKRATPKLEDGSYWTI
jgi:hypothetical protein